MKMHRVSCEVGIEFLDIASIEKKISFTFPMTFQCHLPFYYALYLSLSLSQEGVRKMVNSLYFFACILPSIDMCRGKEKEQSLIESTTVCRHSHTGSECLLQSSEAVRCSYTAFYVLINPYSRATISMETYVFIVSLSNEVLFHF